MSFANGTLIFLFKERISCFSIVLMLFYRIAAGKGKHEPLHNLQVFMRKLFVCFSLIILFSIFPLSETRDFVVSQDF